ncbi:hypothetical protein SKTS_18850 [Sulfurimicrobium lacus]|uniref:Uncharacterized protein n=1 Tax=Sulfurimicrobium lacus TaxID=2715678 RepID=A0A6F8VE39_9PROT|nr:hypothetical protein SKTS_18850 [Sulfurimicrobium lacus]
MMCRWFYADEKLSRAVRLLAVLPGDVRSRLLNAFMEFHPLTEADFPPKLRKHYRWVMKQLTKRGPMLDYKGEVYRGSVEHTLSHIRNSTGAKIAERLVMLHDEVAEAIRIETTSCPR